MNKIKIDGVDGNEGSIICMRHGLEFLPGKLSEECIEYINYISSLLVNSLKIQANQGIKIFSSPKQRTILTAEQVKSKINSIKGGLEVCRVIKNPYLDIDNRDGFYFGLEKFNSSTKLIVSHEPTIVELDKYYSGLGYDIIGPTNGILDDGFLRVREYTKGLPKFLSPSTIDELNNKASEFQF